MQDDSKPLSEVGVTPQSRVLVMKGASGAAPLAEHEQRKQRMDKLMRVLGSMASRDGRGLTDDYAFSLENQVCGPAAHGAPLSARARVPDWVMVEGAAGCAHSGRG
jgi:hypothetical protein